MYRLDVFIGKFLNIVNDACIDIISFDNLPLIYISILVTRYKYILCIIHIYIDILTYRPEHPVINSSDV